MRPRHTTQAIATHVRSLLIAVALTLSIASCGQPDIGTGDGSGVVRRVDRTHKMITLDHGAVGSLMQPMTMAYPVETITLMDEILPNDTVSFTLREDTPGNFVITKIHKQ